GSFEEVSDPGCWLTLAAGTTAVPAWTVSHGTIAVHGRCAKGSHGSRCLELNGDDPGEIQQTLRTVPGQAYRVHFDLASHPLGPAVTKLRVTAAGRSADFAFDRTGRTYQELGWVSKSWDFTATAASTTLAFSSLHTPGGHGA